MSFKPLIQVEVFPYYAVFYKVNCVKLVAIEAIGLERYAWTSKIQGLN